MTRIQTLQRQNGQIVVNVDPRCDPKICIADVEKDIVARLYFDARL